MYDDFLKAIHEKWIVTITFDSEDKGVITRTCVPYDYGPSNRYHDGRDRYHFQDLNSPEGSHPLSILPKQIKHLEISNKSFNPSDYIKWTPRWHVKRDWGNYS